MQNSKGFSLIELMIVVAIIGILAGIAFPSYQESIRKANRTDAQTELLQFSAALERQYVRTGNYTSILNDSTCTAQCVPVASIFTAGQDAIKNYAFTVTINTATNSYTVYASPQSGGRMSGDGPFILQSDGTKGWAKGLADNTSDTSQFTSQW